MQENSSHRFDLGSLVRLANDSYRQNAAPGFYEVRAQLPTRNGVCQYRIKSSREPYDRVVGENELRR